MRLIFDANLTGGSLLDVYHMSMAAYSGDTQSAGLVGVSVVSTLLSVLCGDTNLGCTRARRLLGIPGVAAKLLNVIKLYEVWSDNNFQDDFIYWCGVSDLVDTFVGDTTFKNDDKFGDYNRELRWSNPNFIKARKALDLSTTRRSQSPPHETSSEVRRRKRSFSTKAHPDQHRQKPEEDGILQTNINSAHDLLKNKHWNQKTSVTFQ